jgi:hypothetical protein
VLVEQAYVRPSCKLFQVGSAAPNGALLWKELSD